MNFPFVHFRTVFQLVSMITVETLELILVVLFNMKPKNFHFWWSEATFLAILDKHINKYFLRSFIDGNWLDLIFEIKRIWSFVIISTLKFVISLFMVEICVSSSLVFSSVLLFLQTNELLVGYFSTMFASFIYISLRNSLMTQSFMSNLWHLGESVCSLGLIVLSAFSKKNLTFLSIIAMFLTSVSSTSCVTPPISWSSAISTICH